MRLCFDPGLPHQAEALSAVLDVFEGGTPGEALPVDDATLLANLQAVQRARGLAVDETVPRASEGDAPARVDLSIEMETGTGKTYTYLRTILELSRRHGLSRWLVIVPSVAIREGVMATLRASREHFRGLMPEVSYRFWAYDGRPERVAAFARSSQLQIGVLTIDAFNKIGNRLRRPDDRFGGESALSWVRRARPCVVLDEPHRYGSALSKASLSRLHPRLLLRYGATHREPVGLVHRLTPTEAAARGLVKRVEVHPVDATGDDEARMSAQIRETIALHVQRQARLEARGIKVLSLLFVERVDDYAHEDGLARVLFDRHFEALKGGCDRLAGLAAARVRSGYFAARRGVAVATSGETAADEAAYQLIMRDKLRLLSLEEPVSFVFSHSALREGWDNPNVFQVCTLAPRGSTIRRRQEIGRGVRLCVDASGRRVLDPDVDVLSVIPAERYEDFVAAWAAEDASGDRRRPVPARAGGRSSEAAVVEDEAPAWVEVDTEALVADARGRLGEPGSGGAAPELVAALLGRQRPPIVLTPGTVARVARGYEDAVAVARAIAEAVGRQVGRPATRS